MPGRLVANTTRIALDDIHRAAIADGADLVLTFPDGQRPWTLTLIEAVQS